MRIVNHGFAHNRQRLHTTTSAILRKTEIVR
jgi:hypothetical protein